MRLHAMMLTRQKKIKMRFVSKVKTEEHTFTVRKYTKLNRNSTTID